MSEDHTVLTGAEGGDDSRSGETGSGGVDTGGVETGGSRAGDTGSGGTEAGGTVPGGTEAGGSVPGGVEAGGSRSGETGPSGVETGVSRAGDAGSGVAPSGGVESDRTGSGGEESGETRPGRPVLGPVAGTDVDVTEARSDIVLVAHDGIALPGSFPEFNTYATKKTLASGLLDIGLLMANAAQLKALVDLGPSGQDYFYPNIVFISLSITLQVVVGIIMIVLGDMTIKTEQDRKRAHRLNDVIVGFVLVVLVVNLFIAAFGMSGERKTLYNNSTKSP